MEQYRIIANISLQSLRSICDTGCCFWTWVSDENLITCVCPFTEPFVRKNIMIDCLIILPITLRQWRCWPTEEYLYYQTRGWMECYTSSSQHHVKREREGDIQSPPRPIIVVIYGQRGEYNYCNYLLLAEIRGCSSLGSARSGWSGGPIVQVMKVMVIYCHIFEFFFHREWRLVSDAERTEWRWRRQLLWLFLSFRFNRVNINAGEP